MEMVGRGKEGRGAMGFGNRRLRSSPQGEEEDRREEMLMEAICGESENDNVLRFGHRRYFVWGFRVLVVEE